MAKPQRRPLRTRVVLRLVRWLLWPAARTRPDGAWAKIYRRIRAMEESNDPIMSMEPARKLRSPKVWLVVLIAAALLLWLRDLVRRPAPAAEINHAACTTGG